MERREFGRAPVVGWPAKRVAALVLTLGLAALGAYAWWAGVGDRRTGWLLCVGVALGATYTARGGSLPPLVHKLTGSKVTADDDPRNLSPKLYIPIVLAAVLAAIAAYALYGPRR